MSSIRLTQATAVVLRALATGHRHGFEIMEASGLASGTVYPILRRLERSGLVTSVWEEDEKARGAGRPRRRMYRLSERGEGLAVEAGERLRDVGRLLAADPLVEGGDVAGGT